MTIKEHIQKQFDLPRLQIQIGGFVLCLGIVLGMESTYILFGLVLNLIGFGLIVISLFIAFYRIACPCCALKYGKIAYLHSNVSFKLDSDMTFCPKCGVNLENEFPNC
ncbi:MAG: hypothetical protein PVJ39_07395 [Gammaproteobacteria bacterium]|jgi:hypothetical protein